LGGVWWTVTYDGTYEVLFDMFTVLEPALQEDTPTALITRLADRARDRHAREDQFRIYDHYLSHYWEHRTAAIEIVDTIGKGGNTITFNVTTEWKLSPTEAELRFFYRGLNTVAEYYNNGVMTAVPALDIPGEDARHYTRSLNYNQKFNRPLQIGDRLEFELSQFLDAVPNGRNNYYGTAILYIVGQGVVPWEARGANQDSFPMPVEGWLGGNATLPYQYSDEPDNHFLQMATNLSGINGQVFVEGRRVHHTDFGDGSHNESVTNPDFTELASKLGTHYVNRSCVACHAKNGRALPPAVGEPLGQYVFRVGDAGGGPDTLLGAVLQPQSTSGAAEGDVTIASWNESNGLRSPVFSFTGVTPEKFSARIAPQLVGMGLLEAIKESDIAALADPDDADGDGISGRMRLVTDAETGKTRIGRFGWKAAQPSVKQQVASALNTDMGVMSSIHPAPDCGALQLNCGPAGAELSDLHLDNLTAYISLLGVSARRDLQDPTALQGEALFDSAGCTGCHTDTYRTSAFHPHAELRDQIIHPYTDLLLHDMGPGLASTLPEGNASGAEWRTPPLWNIGLTAGVSGGEAYLHDGRARSLHEAIMWHGGEAQASRQAYDDMTQGEKDALVAFLKSL
ncbi:MAG: di-heme oxidoredictase family protein, partial [Thiohalobacterales bacterium]|nr:di-heme oxidoredictase family protein [Thiohalobacterales bacterium]